MLHKCLPVKMCCLHCHIQAYIKVQLQHFQTKATQTYTAQGKRTWELVFLLDNMLSIFFPISSKSESSPDVDSSSVDRVSVDVRTLQERSQAIKGFCHFPYHLQYLSTDFAFVHHQPHISFVHISKQSNLILISTVSLICNNQGWRDKQQNHCTVCT